MIFQPMTNYWRGVAFILFTSIARVIDSSQLIGEWEKSSNLEKWYTPLDLCLLRNDTALPIEIIMNECVQKIMLNTASTTELQPNRCRAGNSWPSKGLFCDSEDIPYAKRDKLQSAIKGFDDPSQQPLRKLFTSLAKEKGALLLIGDSVMQQYYSAMACELEREGVWKDPSQFKDTDALKYVNVDVGGNGKVAHSVPIRFTPIYHFVNGKYDRVANASMHHLRKAVDSFLGTHDSLMIFLNMGLHYVSNPIPQFSKKDYEVQITEALQYLHSKALEYKGKKKIRIIWRETSAQHFPTYNGYWPGVKYAVNMDVKCVPVKDSSQAADWRNEIARNIIFRNKFDISIAPFYNQTLPLWSQHVNGHLRDCTHWCWTPMLYQPLFHFMADAMT